MSDCASGSPASTAPTAHAASPQAISEVTPNDEPGSLSRSVGVDADHEEQRGREGRERGTGAGGAEREVAQPRGHHRTFSTCQPASRSAEEVVARGREDGALERAAVGVDGAHGDGRVRGRDRPRRGALHPGAVGGAVAQAQDVGQRDPSRRGARVVGEQDGGAGLEALGDLRRQRRAAVVVQARERLVEQQQRAPGLQRLEQRDALEHAAAEGRRRAVEDRGVEAARAGGGVPVRRGQPAQGPHRAQPLAGAQGGREAHLLGHERARGVTSQRPRPRRRQPGEHAQEARLAAAVRARDVDGAAGVDRQRDARQHGAPPAPDRERPRVEQHRHPGHANNAGAPGPQATLRRNLARFWYVIEVWPPSASPSPLCARP